MILCDDTRSADLTPFGILIPIAPDRAARTVAHLTPILGRALQQRRRRPTGERCSRADLLRVHAPPFVARLLGEGLEEEILRTYELIDAAGNHQRYDPARATRPLTDLFDLLLADVSGTCEACRLALDEGFCFYFGGGLHHAHHDHGSGFCLLNDAVIALRKLQAEGRIASAWIIDLDAHKGDGTAALTAGDPSIRTLSIHMAHGWPLDTAPRDAAGRLALPFTPSDVDLPVAPGQEDLYVPLLAAGLDKLGRLSTPDLAIVLAGADPFEGDELASAAELNLTLAQLADRDRTVFDFLTVRGIPRAYVTAGGYGRRAWEVDARFLQWVLEREA